MAISNRVVIICVAFTFIATFYSLSELHKLSAIHTNNQDETHAFATTSSPQVTATALTTSAAAVVTTRSQATSATVAPKVVTAVVISPPPPVAAAAAAVAVGGKCYTYEHTELWGDVVAWGSNNKMDSAAACCESCRSFKPAGGDDQECNVWVWCGDAAKCGGQYRECWLKHLVRPEASKPAKQGPTVAWTSGTMDVDLNADPSKNTASPGSKKYHVVTSAQGTAVHWQCRIHYYWYLKIRGECEKEGPCDMGGWTRLLHSGNKDDLMDELPTIVVNPLPSDMVEHSWYIVLNRPYAFVQWVEQAKIPERYVLMSEPDHIFLRPLPNLMNGDVPASFPFFYIEPANKEHAHITRKFVGDVSRKELELIAPIGNSPTFMTMDDMKKTMSVWMNVSIAVFKDPEANKGWGWVQEMYGFTIALYKVGIKQVDLYLHLMAQPPWDDHMVMAPNKPFYILHYTYGMDYKTSGEFTPGVFGEWRFDKRTHSQRPPKKLEEPPLAVKNELVRHLIQSLNEGMEKLPCWDQYSQTGKILPCAAV